ncbi:MAG: hypothetical protein ABIJ40_19775 [Bacteroidota bacterium]
MKIKILDLWNKVPDGYPKYIGILPYMLWVESYKPYFIGCFFIGFLHYAIVFEINHLNLKP